MITTVAVIIPANNEAQSIGPCLDALVKARVHATANARRRLDVHLVVVLDGCTDSTETIVGSRSGVDSISCAVGTAGGARAIGTKHVLERWSGPRSHLWLANTDADSRVPGDWISTMVREADCGAAMVLGTVVPSSDLDSRVRRAWFAQHDLHDNHPHIHGANLGIRADAYLRMGGWSHRGCGEDVELARRASAAGLAITRTGLIPVVTSARTSSRTAGGFADYLHGLDAAVNS